MPFQTVKHYENYLSRLRAFPEFMDQNIALMRGSLKARHDGAQGHSGRDRDSIKYWSPTIPRRACCGRRSAIRN